MARKLERDEANKRTFMRENVQGNIITGTRTCAQCRKTNKVLYHYWWEPDIDGQDKPDKYALPFCSVNCYRVYNNEMVV